MADTVTTATLARHFGVTPRAIGDLVKRKVIDRWDGSGPASFDLEDSTRRAMTLYRALAQGRGGEVDVGKCCARCGPACSRFRAGAHNACRI